MATAVLHPDPQKFPAGATAKAYARSDWPSVGAISGAPPGSQVASATVASDGSVSLSSLTAGTRYVLYCNPSGSIHNYSFFSTLEDPDGGGSAFDHLTEDAENFVERTDWGFAATAEEDFSTTYSYLDPSGRINSVVATAEEFGIGIQVAGDTELRAALHGDGSLHWGDGTNPPDVSLERDDGVLLADSQITSLGQVAFAGRQEADTDNRIELYGEDGSIWAGDGSGSTDTDWTRAAPGVWGISANGGGLQLKTAGGDPVVITAVDDPDNPGEFTLDISAA